MAMVYLDASFVNACVTDRTDPRSTVRREVSREWWNVRHMANPNKTAHLQVICRRLGLVPPQIVTPDFLWRE